MSSKPCNPVKDTYVNLLGKPSVRSRALHLSLGNGTHFDRHHPETELLIDELRSAKLKRSDGCIFSDSKYVTMSEKGLRHLCAELANLKKASTDEMCQHVYANYKAFISTSLELSELEGEIINMRTLVSEQASLIHGLVDAVQLEFISDKVDVASERDPVVEENQASLQDIEMILDNLDVFIAERSVNEAVATLYEGEEMIMQISEDDQAGDTLIKQLQTTLSERRERLTNQLVEVVQHASTSRRELCSAISSLCRLGEGHHAHSLLLKVHKQKLLSNVQGLRASSTWYGGAYTFTLSQFVFSALSQAAKDSQFLFGEQASCVSELLLWVSDEVADFASLVERHVLLPASTTGCLHAAVECVQTALGYCSLLEDEGLMLCPTLLKLFRPILEKTLQAYVQHIKDSVVALALVDDWVVSFPSGAHLKLSTSAQKFQKLMLEFFEDAVPLANMQLGGLLLDNCGYLLDCYVDILVKAIPKPRFDTSSDAKDVILAKTERQQLGLWANASAFAEDILPREEARKRAQSTASSSRGSETREWKRRLQRSVERLRDLYCQNQVLDLFFNEEGLSNFNADAYLLLEDDTDISQAMPSPLCQELFFKLNKLNQVSGDVLPGRERTTVSLLSKLLETFVFFILEDHGFWEGIEAGARPLGQAGLQKFMLDMHFVIQIATQGHYSTRRIGTVVLEIINRAIEAFDAEGLDPYSILPEDEWFLQLAASCMEKLSFQNSA
ncbi:hypothetical protein GOP47_0009637 [Adiantum capillus-veneris]|uniref:Exocyst component Exo84 C-terminal domain-containing protein n=1 Tax=Adiantum capillus-veneris TaxID=13818 RepID=A0A9D4UX67_ADICA|nr:hypothetical protein GOP47_0009637 [Adiantum capillus-veneris]